VRERRRLRLRRHVQVTFLVDAVGKHRFVGESEAVAGRIEIARAGHGGSEQE
jgi:hypothetical protein